MRVSIHQPQYLPWLPYMQTKKRTIATAYQQWGSANGVQFVHEPINTKANYWLNMLITEDKKVRDEWLQQTNNLGVMTRPAWTPMHQLEINKDALCTDMSKTNHLYSRLINVPSSTRK